MPSFCNVSGCNFTYDPSRPNDLKTHKRIAHVPEVKVIYPNSTQEVVLGRNDRAKFRCLWCNFSLMYLNTIQVRNYYLYDKIHYWMILCIRNMPERNARVFLSFLQALRYLLNPPSLPLVPALLYFLGRLRLPLLPFPPSRMRVIDPFLMNTRSSITLHTTYLHLGSALTPDSIALSVWHVIVRSTATMLYSTFMSTSLLSISHQISLPFCSRTMAWCHTTM